MMCFYSLFYVLNGLLKEKSPLKLIYSANVIGGEVVIARLIKNVSSLCYYAWERNILSLATS